MKKLIISNMQLCKNYIQYILLISLSFKPYTYRMIKINRLNMLGASSDSINEISNTNTFFNKFQTHYRNK